MLSKTIAVLGAGNMGEALVRGLVDTRTVTPDRVVLSDPRAEVAEALAASLGARVAEDNRDAVSGADVVLVAVKPQVLAGVLADLVGVGDGPLFISVVAGVPTSVFEKGLGLARVVRAMPNTPALVREGATAIAPGRFATDEDKAVARRVFEAVGLCVVVDESHLDAVTGLSGSGPAYVMVFIEALADAGVKVGLPRAVALALATQTVRGSVALLAESGEHPAALKDRVTSPGGTTIHGLHALESAGLRSALMNAVEAATVRAGTLGSGFDATS